MAEILSGVKNIYLVGIGGIGMSGLAFLLRDKGFNVRGSDLQDGSNVKMLRDKGVDVFIGHRKENITADINLVTYSSAVKEDNPEMQEAKRLGKTILKRGELLGLLSWDKKTIAVAGSHGKTTTTAMIGYLLEKLDYKPTVFVGGIALNNYLNAWWGQDYFVIETDESDGSFLYYNPWVSIITNIDHEHLDYHKTIEKLRENFLKFAYNTKGKVFGCGDDPVVKEILLKTKGITYGFDEDNIVRAEDVSFDGQFTSFSLFIEGKYITSLRTSLLGQHNVLNTLAVFSFLNYLGADIGKAATLLPDFKGTKRRFQIKEICDGVTFVDDYAHHPTEISAVLKAARCLKPKRVVAILQPHRFSRVKALVSEFSHCLSLADYVIITDIYSACEQEIDGIDANIIYQQAKKEINTKIDYIPKNELIVKVPAMLKEGDVVIGLGAGDINTIMDNIVNEFKQNKV